MSLRVLKRPASCLSEAGGESGIDMAMPSLEEGSTLYVNDCVVYHNPNLRSWRVKVGKGSRFTKCFGWGRDPDAQWAKVLEYCRQRPEAPY